MGFIGIFKNMGNLNECGLIKQTCYLLNAC